MTLSLYENAEILNIIEAIEVAEASRKPAIYGNLTFYGANDQWYFTAYNTGNTCNTCGDLDGETFYGNELRRLFKYHVIIDENTIYAKVHPNCACILSRVFNVEKLKENLLYARVFRFNQLPILRRCVAYP